MTKSKAAQAATARYEAKACDIIRLLLPKGSKARIQATGETVNGFIKRAVLAELDTREAQASRTIPADDPPTKSGGEP